MSSDGLSALHLEQDDNQRSTPRWTVRPAAHPRRDSRCPGAGYPRTRSTNSSRSYAYVSPAAPSTNAVAVWQATEIEKIVKFKLVQSG